MVSGAEITNRVGGLKMPFFSHNVNRISGAEHRLDGVGLWIKKMVLRVARTINLCKTFQCKYPPGTKQSHKVYNK